MEHNLISADETTEDLLRRMFGAADTFLDENLTALSDAAIIARLELAERVNRILFAGRVHLVAEIDQRGLCKSRGSRTTGAFLRNTLNIGPGEAYALVRVAVATRTGTQPSGAVTPAKWAEVAAAMQRGDLCAESASIVVTFLNKVAPRITPELQHLAEDTLVEQAAIADPTVVRHAIKEVEVRVDPDGTLPKEATRRMTFTIGNRGADGLTPVNGKLDDITIEQLKCCLSGLAAPKPTVDGIPDSRSAGERTAQGLCEVTRRFLTSGVAPKHGGVRPQVTVFMNLEDFLDGLPADTFPATGVPTSSAGPEQVLLGPCLTPRAPGVPPALVHTKRHGALLAGTVASARPRLSYGGTINPGIARQLACDARILPIVLNGNGQILDVGREMRSFPIPIRNAATARDQGCSFPACDIPAPWTDGHHVIPWSQGGETSLDNCALLCGRHHTLIHQNDWTMRIADDGHPEFFAPTWFDYDQKPFRNTLHHPHG